MIDGLTYVPLSDIGMEREENQDYQGHDITRHGLLVVVADGMGGHAGGATASQMTVNIIKRALRENEQLGPARALEHAIRVANHAIWRTSQERVDLRGMGSTVVAMLMTETLAYIAHVGDSRIYMMRDGRLMQMTKDHTMVQRLVDDGLLSEAAARNHPASHVLSRSLGGLPDVLVETAPYPLRLKSGDIFLLCSDGLTGPLEDHEVGHVIQEFPLHDAARIFVDEANARGGYDNTTIALIRVDDLPLKNVRSIPPVIEQADDETPPPPPPNAPGDAPPLDADAADDRDAEPAQEHDDADAHDERREASTEQVTDATESDDADDDDTESDDTDDDDTDDDATDDDATDDDATDDDATDDDATDDDDTDDDATDGDGAESEDTDDDSNADGDAADSAEIVEGDSDTDDDDDDDDDDDADEHGDDTADGDDEEQPGEQSHDADEGDADQGHASGDEEVAETSDEPDDGEQKLATTGSTELNESQSNEGFFDVDHEGAVDATQIAIQIIDLDTGQHLTPQRPEPMDSHVPDYGPIHEATPPLNALAAAPAPSKLPFLIVAIIALAVGILLGFFVGHRPVPGLNQSLSGAQERIGALESAIQSTRQERDQLQRQLFDQQTRARDLSVERDSLRDKVNEVNALYNASQETIKTLREKIEAAEPPSEDDGEAPEDNP